MGHQLACRAAVDGKPPVSKTLLSTTIPTSELFAQTRRLTFAAVAFFVTSLAAPTSYAQSSGPYAGMAGKWALNLGAKVQGEPGTVRGNLVYEAK